MPEIRITFFDRHYVPLIEYSSNVDFLLTHLSPPSVSDPSQSLLILASNFMSRRY